MLKEDYNCSPILRVAETPTNILGMDVRILYQFFCFPSKGFMDPTAILLPIHLFQEYPLSPNPHPIPLTFASSTVSPQHFKLDMTTRGLKIKIIFFSLFNLSGLQNKFICFFKTIFCNLWKTIHIFLEKISSGTNILSSIFKINSYGLLKLIPLVNTKPNSKHSNLKNLFSPKEMHCLQKAFYTLLSSC